MRQTEPSAAQDSSTDLWGGEAERSGPLRWPSRGVTRGATPDGPPDEGADGLRAGALPTAEDPVRPMGDAPRDDRGTPADADLAVGHGPGGASGDVLAGAGPRSDTARADVPGPGRPGADPLPRRLPRREPRAASSEVPGGRRRAPDPAPFGGSGEHPRPDDAFRGSGAFARPDAAFQDSGFQNSGAFARPDGTRPGAVPRDSGAFARPIGAAHESGAFARPVGAAHESGAFARPDVAVHRSGAFARPVVPGPVSDSGSFASIDGSGSFGGSGAFARPAGPAAVSDSGSFASLNGPGGSGAFARPDGIDPFAGSGGFARPAAGPFGAVPPSAPEPGALDPVLVGVIRRLRAQSARQAALAEQLRGGETRPAVLADLAELAAAARRARRDTDTLLTLVCGESGRHSGGSMPLGDLLREVASGLEDAARIVVAPAASVAVTPAGAEGLRQVLAEVIAHAGGTTGAGARIDVMSHWAEAGGVAVEVLVAGLGLLSDEALDLDARLGSGDCTEAPGDRIGLFVAARLARRAGMRVGVCASPGHPPAPGLALIGAVHCPPQLLVDATPRSPDATGPEPDDSWTEAGPGWPDGRANAVPTGELWIGNLDRSDALFGPLAGAELSGDDMTATPIFAEIASAWFRSGGTHAVEQDDDWETGTGAEWRIAAERAARVEAPSLTGSGLPRRRPGEQMVPPPRRGAVPAAAGPAPQAVNRVPDLVRRRLASYQRGLDQGRHRASEGSTTESAAE